MQKLLVLALAGFFAQLIDGSLGMAYGVTSSSLLLAYGLAPAVVSATVHLSEIATTAASGISHWKLDNVDKKTLVRLTIPGAIGAFTGACFLSHLNGEIVKPYISMFLFCLGFYVLFRFLFQFNPAKSGQSRPLTKKQSVPLGFIAGFLDSTGGGGWGPVTTPVLLSKKDMAPRKAVGTVDTSEFVIAVSASCGFLISLGWKGINLLWAGVLISGGVIAAPIAAWLVRKIPARLMGIIVGGFIILINLRTILNGLFPNSGYHLYVYAIFILGWMSAIVYGLRMMKLERKNESLSV